MRKYQECSMRVEPLSCDIHRLYAS
jgi:hypothetical protein